MYRLPREPVGAPDSRFRTIRYLGNKRKLSNAICESIEEVGSAGNHVTDLFAGSCSISYQMKRTHQLLSNDDQLYSYNLAKAIIENEEERVSSIQAAEELAGTCNEHVETLSGQMKTRLAKEALLLVGDFDNSKTLREYSSFCSRTPFVNGGAPLGDMREAILGARACRDGVSKRNPWALFTAYFSNAYFGLNQCIQIDGIRRAIAEMDPGGSPYRRHLYLAALTYSLSQSVSSPGHFAQFLKPTSPAMYRRLQRERTKTIWTLFLQNVDMISSFITKTPFDHTATCEDWRIALSAENHRLSRKKGVVYADPPYTADHYSRYYHVLNTLIQYDYPDCIGTGRYRSGRLASPFSVKSQAKDEFGELIKSAAKSGSCLVISYSNRGVVKVRTILGLCRRNFRRVQLRWTGHTHSNQGRQSDEANPAELFRREYLISCSGPL